MLIRISRLNVWDTISTSSTKSLNTRLSPESELVILNIFGYRTPEFPPWGWSEAHHIIKSWEDGFSLPSRQVPQATAGHGEEVKSWVCQYWEGRICCDKAWRRNAISIHVSSGCIVRQDARGWRQASTLPQDSDADLRILKTAHSSSKIPNGDFGEK